MAFYLAFISLSTCFPLAFLWLSIGVDDDDDDDDHDDHDHDHDDDDDDDHDHDHGHLWGHGERVELLFIRPVGVPP